MSLQGVVARDSRAELVKVLETGQVPRSVAQEGKELLARMDTPLRLCVMGMPGSGKSTLMNLLLNSDVFPKNLPLPTVSLTYADQPGARCTLSDGNVREIEATDLAAIAKLKPVFVELMMPLAALRKLSMMEVVAGDDPAQQQRAIRWAAKRTDIALWCTQNCSELEERLWSLLPRNVQDHSFLVLTKADALGAQGRLARLAQDANEIGQSYFKKVLPVATRVALSARKSNGTVDKAVLRSSGGIALITAIMREVEAAATAASDAATAFLDQIEIVAVETEPEAEPAELTVAPPVVNVALQARVKSRDRLREESERQEAAETAKAPQTAKEAEEVEVTQTAEVSENAKATETVETPKIVEAPAAVEAPEVVAAPEPEAAEAPETIEEPEAAEVPEAATAPVSEAPKPAAAPAMSQEVRALCEQAVSQLKAEGEALAHQFEEGDLAPQTVIDVSVDTVTWLADYLGDKADSDEPALIRSRQAADDAADLVQLIQLEKGDSVALDALGLMIQLKHEIQAELAA